MNFDKLTKLSLAVLASAISGELALTSTALGQTFTWTNSPLGTWNNHYNWSPVDGAPPNSPNVTASFNRTGGTKGTRTVSLTGGPFVVGTLVFGDPGQSFTFKSGTLYVAKEIDEQGTVNFASDTSVLFLGSAMTVNTLGSITFAGTVSGGVESFGGPRSSLIKTGSGALTLDGQTMVRQLYVNAGSLNSQTGTILDVDGVVDSSAQVTLNGPNANWQNSSHLTIADASLGRLILQNGSKASANLVIIGSQKGSQGMVQISGGATLAGIDSRDSRGNISYGEIDLGFDTGSSGRVDMFPGSTISATFLRIGTNGGNGTLNISGGAVSASQVDIGFQPGSTGSVQLNTRTLDVSGELNIGNSGNGTLVINGRVTDVTGVIGMFPGSSGTVTVNSGGSWNNSGALYIGGTKVAPSAGARFGLLRINTGGIVSAAQTTIWNFGTLELGGQFMLQSPLTIVGGIVRSVDNNLIPNSVTLGSGGAILDSNNFFSTYSGNFSGPGGITKTNPGTVTLTGTNTYTGDTVLVNGTLTVGSPEALGTGNMTVIGGVLNSILGLGPGLAINVKGNYTQNSGGALQLKVKGASPGEYGFINVGKDASLNGQLQLVDAGFTPAGGNSLTVLKAGGVVTSKFAELVNPFPTNPSYNTIEMVYHGHSVDVNFLKENAPTGLPAVATVGPPDGPVVVSTDDVASFAETPNELAVGNMLNAVSKDSRAAKLFSFLENEPLANLPGDLEKITPDGDLTAIYEIGFSGANIQKLNLEQRLDDVRNGSSGFSSNITVNQQSKLESRSGLDGKSSRENLEPILQPTAENRWGLWLTGVGDFVTVDADSNATGYNFTTGGVSLGIDYRVTDSLTFGVFGNYSHTWADLKPGDIGVDTGRGGLYATYFKRGFSGGTFYLNGGIYGGYNSYDTRRPALVGVATGNTDGGEFSTFVSGGYDFHLRQLTVGPIGSLQYTNVYLSGFSEQGSLAPLRIHSDSEESLRTDLGARAFYQWKIGKCVLEPSIQTVWEHEFKYSAIPITASFAQIPGPSATFVGPKEGQDSAILTAGLSIQWSPKILTYVNYNGQLGRTRYDSNAVNGGVSFSF